MLNCDQLVEYLVDDTYGSVNFPRFAVTRKPPHTTEMLLNHLFLCTQRVSDRYHATDNLRSLIAKNARGGTGCGLARLLLGIVCGGTNCIRLEVGRRQARLLRDRCNKPFQRRIRLRQHLGGVHGSTNTVQPLDFDVLEHTVPCRPVVCQKLTQYRRLDLPGIALANP